jgi:DNA polymerase type B, organellar and viral
MNRRDDYSAYLAKHKFNKTNVIKVYNYLKEHPELLSKDNNNQNMLDLLTSKMKNETFYLDYDLKESFKDIDVMELNDEDVFMEEDLVKYMGLVNEYDEGLDSLFVYRFKFLNILVNLEKDRIFKMIFRWESVESDDLGYNRRYYNTSPSFFVYNGLDVSFILYRFISYANVYSSKYSFSDSLNLDVFVKEWVKYDDLKTFDKMVEHIKLYEEERKVRVLKAKERQKMMDLKMKSFYNNELFGSGRRKRMYLCEIIKGINYGIKMSNEDILKYDLVNRLNLMDKIAHFEFYYNNIGSQMYIVKVLNLEDNMKQVCVYLGKELTNNHIIKDSVNDNVKSVLVLESWMDKITYESYDSNINKVIVDRRVYNTGHIIQFIDNELNKIENLYNNKQLLESYKDFDKDSKLGVIDIETYNNHNHEAVPYSIGFKTEDNMYTYYLDDFLNSDEMILTCVNQMMVNQYHHFKFYAHNMSEFDGILILKSLMKTKEKHGFNIKVYSNNDGKIISIDISKKLKNKKSVKISVLDSCLLLPLNLKDLGTVFNCEVDKGIFPYEFINEDSIVYKGNVPDFVFYSKYLSWEEYINLKNSFDGHLWDAKIQTLLYLEKDLLSLFEVIMKFKEIIFYKFGVNITRVRTISGLAFLIFTSNYYDHKKIPIHFTKGKLENFVRKAYYGGIVDVIEHYTDYNTYKYDVNSHYPYAMMKPMPGGLPRISSERNLDNIFGFVEAIVEAPTEKELKVPILPINVEGKMKLFRGKVTGVWWSEELKMARSYGYKIQDIISCVLYDKVEGTFDNYIKDIYQCKQQADKDKNKVIRYIYKLLLNSLYGRLGLRPQNTKLSLIHKDRLDKILHTENADVLFNANDLYLVKTNGPLDPELIRIVNEEKLYLTKNTDFNAPNV